MESIKMSFFTSLQEAAELWEEEEERQIFSSFDPEYSDTLKETPENSDLEGTQCPIRKIARTRRWTDFEDQLLVEIVPRHKRDWKKIAKYFPGKPKSAVRRRWENKFDPDIKKTPWTQAEDRAILTLLAHFGPVWKEISKGLPGRPPDIVKNRYYGHIKRMQDIKQKKCEPFESVVQEIMEEKWEPTLVESDIGLFHQRDEEPGQDNKRHRERKRTRTAKSDKI
jgi:hypothetical protein